MPPGYLGPPVTDGSAPTVSVSATPGPALTTFRRRSLPLRLIGNQGFNLRGLGVDPVTNPGGGIAQIAQGVQKIVAASGGPGANQNQQQSGQGTPNWVTYGVWIAGGLVAASVLVAVLKNMSGRPRLGRPIRGVQAYEKWQGE